MQQLPSLAPPQVFDLLRDVGEVRLIGPPGTQQLGIPHGPLVIIALVEFSRAHNPIIDRYRDFNCSGSTA